jgi:hypothetical protein
MCAPAGQPADALPPVLDALHDTSDPCEREALDEIAGSIARDMPADTGWSSWNLARSRATEHSRKQAR